jgi:LPXTG-site transpeptidase (sortase) family protein
MRPKYIRLFILLPFSILLSILFTTIVKAADAFSRITDINKGVSNSGPSEMVVFKNKLYFAVFHEDGIGLDFWSYDGINSPSLAEANVSNSIDTGISDLIVFNNKMYFGTDGGDGSGFELWSFDGSNSPTLAADIWNGSNSSSVSDFVVFNNKLYFRANGGDGLGVELWSYNGNNPPSLVADINSGSNNSFPAYLTVFNNRLYFGADGGDSFGRELWSYDGINSPSRVADINSGPNSSWISGLTVFNNKLFFRADGGDNTGLELWSYDGSNPPNRVADIWGGENNSDPWFMTVFNNKLYFGADGGDGGGRELWLYDGSNSPSRAADIWSGANGSDPWFLTVFNNNLFFSADGGDGAGIELWKFYTIDNSPPVVNASIPNEGETIHSVNSLLATFSEEMKQDSSPDAVDNTSNYLLVEANGDGFQTTTCVLGPTGNDIQIGIDSAVYDNHNGSGPFEVTLGINGGSPLYSGSYRLFICGTTSIEDMAGNKINGGQSDTTISFTVLDIAAITLPKTGFASGVLTRLPEQPENKSYDKLGSIWLDIPSQDILSTILGIPFSKEGWELTWLGSNVGWLQGTAFPTWAGNSVLSAHVSNADGQPGLFANLYKLTWGDEVIIHAWGQSYVYEVRNVDNYVPPKDISTIKHEDFPWLTLITCKGYDPDTDSYRWRVVVRAVQVRVE